MLTRVIRFLSSTQSHIINPYTHKPLPPTSYITESQMFTRIGRAQAAQRQWKQVSLSERVKTVSRMVEQVFRDQEKLTPIISEYTGKSRKSIEREFIRLKIVASDLINEAIPALSPKVLSSTDKIQQQALGLALIFPYYSQSIFDSLIHLIPCLISGNAALIKPSDFNPYLFPYLSSLSDSNLPVSNLITNIYIEPSQLYLLRSFRKLKKIIFSGSHSSARHIFEVVVENRFIDCNLFFGGQDAAYVDETANLKEAAHKISKYAFYNAGQSYDCIKRLYVRKEVEEEFVGLLTDEIEKLKIGNPDDPTTDIGPITIPEVSLHFEALINDAVNDDAQCMIGGLVTTDGQEPGLFCEPTLLHHCSTDMRVVQEQIHAPVLCSMVVHDDQQFINEVNETKFSTGLRIFTSQPDRYADVEKFLDVGFVGYNVGSMMDKNLPIQGWKWSGKGKVLSRQSYEEYTVPKTYHIV